MTHAALRTHLPSPEISFRRMTSPAVEDVELDGETVVYDCRSNALHLLDPVASVIWKLFEPPTSIVAVGEHLAQAFHRPVDETVEDVHGFVIQLEHLALVERVGGAHD